MPMSMPARMAWYRNTKCLTSRTNSFPLEEEELEELGWQGQGLQRERVGARESRRAGEQESKGAVYLKEKEKFETPPLILQPGQVCLMMVVASMKSLP